MATSPVAVAMTAKVGIDSSFWSQRKVAQLELRTIRITAIGDQLLAGHGDPRGLGWFGRVMARTQESGSASAVLRAGFPRRRDPRPWPNAGWAKPRAASATSTKTAWCIALSDRDVDLDVSTARSRLNLANILDSASQMNIKALLVGPAPGLDDARNQRVAELNRVYSDVALRRNHHYVDTFTPPARPCAMAC